MYSNLGLSFHETLPLTFLDHINSHTGIGSAIIPIKEEYPKYQGANIWLCKDRVDLGKNSLPPAHWLKRHMYTCSGEQKKNKNRAKIQSYFLKETAVIFNASRIGKM